DGGMALALIVEILSKRQEEITTLFKELPKYYLHKETIKVKHKRKKHVLDYIKNETENEERVLIDGVKIFKDDGSVLIRPSGTEPKFRSFADGKSKESAEKLSKWGIELVQQALK
ncbi:MAG: phosphoglucosamine mutase, partial [Candidatus Hodarchaeota archaeon]